MKRLDVSIMSAKVLKTNGNYLFTTLYSATNLKNNRREGIRLKTNFENSFN